MKTLPPFWFIIDVESIGLHGEAFAVAWQVFAHDAHPFQHRNGAWAACNPNWCSGKISDFQWVTDNVPDLSGSDAGSPRGVRDRFWSEWEAVKREFPGIVMAAECAWPVEARFLNKCVEDDPQNRNWEGPYPLHDISSIMLAAGMDPMRTYARAHEESEIYGPHHPLGDVKHSAWLLHAALKRLRDAFAPTLGWAQPD